MAPKKVKKAATPTSSAASKVCEFLYLGPASAASSDSFINSANITHVLSIGATPSKRYNQISYLRLPLQDTPSSSIENTGDAACIFIQEAAVKGGKVLVHCSAAVSRSPTIVAFYLMKHQEYTLHQAPSLLLQLRPSTSPNNGFLSQLKERELQLMGKTTLDCDALPRKKEDRLAIFKDVELPIIQVPAPIRKQQHE